MINIVSYNTETRLAEAVITISPAKDAEMPTRQLTPDVIFGAFQRILIESLKARLQDCFTQLVMHLDKITAITEYAVEYTQKGIYSHYSFVAAKAMQSAIEKLQRQEYNFNGMEANQMLKALVWVEDKSDKNNLSFAILVDLLVEVMICEPAQREYECREKERQAYETKIESLKSRIKSYESDMNGTVASLNAARKLVDSQKAEIERLQGIINSIRTTVG